MMNEIEKTEIVLGLIAVAKSRLMKVFFIDDKQEDVGGRKKEKLKNDIKELDNLLRIFYEKLTISEEEYNKILRDIKKYE